MQVLKVNLRSYLMHKPKMDSITKQSEVIRTYFFWNPTKIKSAKFHIPWPILILKWRAEEMDGLFGMRRSREVKQSRENFSVLRVSLIHLGQREPWEDPQEISLMIWVDSLKTVKQEAVLVDSLHSNTWLVDSCMCFHVERSVRKCDILPGITQNDPPPQWRGSGNLRQLGSEIAPKEVACQVEGNRRHRTHRRYSIHWPDSFYRHTDLSREHLHYNIRSPVNHSSHTRNPVHQ